MTEPAMASDNLFTKSLSDHMRAVEQMAASIPLLQEIAEALIHAIRGGGTIFWCGNGGSAADAQHMSAELVGRFRRERRGLASIALTTDSSILTALANDYSYDYVFARQLEALCRKGDVVVGISTSGNSANVCNALQTAKDLGASTIAVTGGSGGKMLPLADYCFLAPSNETARIQECHELALHMICDWVENAVSKDNTEK